MLHLRTFLLGGSHSILPVYVGGHAALESPEYVFRR